MAEDSKKPGPLKALLLLIAAGVLYLVQQFTGLDLLGSKSDDKSVADGGSPVEAPAETAPDSGKSWPEKPPKKETKAPAKPDPKPDASKDKDKAKPAPPKEEPKPAADPNGYKLVQSLFKAGTSDAWIECAGEVVHILPTDNYGSRHQQFLVEVGPKITLKIAHNIDLADPVPIEKGDRVEMKGEYEWNDKGGVLHWTHHNPSPNPIKPGGWIKHKGKLYE